MSNKCPLIWDDCYLPHEQVARLIEKAQKLKGVGQWYKGLAPCSITIFQHIALWCSRWKCQGGVLLATEMHPTFSGGLPSMGTARSCPWKDCERLLWFFALLFPPVQGMVLFLGLPSLQMCEKDCEPRTSSNVSSGLIKHTTLSHKSNRSGIQRPSQLKPCPQQKNAAIFIWQSSCCCTG